MKIVEKRNYHHNPFDTHLRYDTIDGRRGELVFSRYGITEELIFVADPVYQHRCDPEEIRGTEAREGFERDGRPDSVSCFI